MCEFFASYNKKFTFTLIRYERLDDAERGLLLAVNQLALVWAEADLLKVRATGAYGSCFGISSLILTAPLEKHI
jgi:hypothetical protein